MIILKIRFIPKPEMSIEDGANFLRDNFPASRKNNALVSVGIIARDDDHFICLKLRQDELTERQRDYLHLDPFAARYVDSFEVDTNPLELDFETKPILALWQAEAIHDILNNQVNKVPSNGNHTRYYTEACAERQWDNKHHLIDIEGKEPMYSDLTITQCSTEGATRISLEYNELDDLLTVLLQWRMDAARASHEAMTKVNDDAIGVGDDHPF